MHIYIYVCIDLRPNTRDLVYFYDVHFICLGRILLSQLFRRTLSLSIYEYFPYTCMCNLCIS